MIRRAVYDDIPQLVDLCHEFALMHPLSDVVSFDKAYVQQGMMAFLQSPSTYVAVSVLGGQLAGAVIGVLAPVLYNPTARTVNEIVWYMRPAYRRSSDGLRLLGALEAWAMDAGVVGVVMTSYVGGAAVDSVYTRRGYMCMEHQWLRALEG